MARYRLQTLTGQAPPRYEHTNIDLAIAEAKRLSEQFDTQVLILEVIGVVKNEEVPVVKKQTTVNIFSKGGPDEDLPF